MEEAHQHCSWASLAAQRRDFSQKPHQRREARTGRAPRLSLQWPGRGLHLGLLHTVNVSALTSPQQPLSQKQGQA